MKRFTFILGSSLLIVAATLAVTITVRNAPPEPAVAAQPAAGSRLPHVLTTDLGDAHAHVMPLDQRRAWSPDRFTVDAPADWLASMSAAEQAAALERVAQVQRDARERLERMTDEFSLTASQRAKMFPLLVRSTPGFDPTMRVGGGDPGAEIGATAEEMHALLDAEQQAQLEDPELARQLWWQDVVSRLERELVDATGGTVPDPAAPEPEPEPAVEEPVDRVAPPRR